MEHLLYLKVVILRFSFSRFLTQPSGFLISNISMITHPTMDWRGAEHHQPERPHGCKPRRLALHGGAPWEIVRRWVSSRNNNELRKKHFKNSHWLYFETGPLIWSFSNGSARFIAWNSCVNEGCGSGRIGSCPARTEVFWRETKKHTAKRDRMLFGSSVFRSCQCWCFFWLLWIWMIRVSKRGFRFCPWNGRSGMIVAYSCSSACFAGKQLDVLHVTCRASWVVRMHSRPEWRCGRQDTLQWSKINANKISI